MALQKQIFGTQSVQNSFERSSGRQSVCDTLTPFALTPSVLQQAKEYQGRRTRPKHPTSRSPPPGVRARPKYRNAIKARAIQRITQNRSNCAVACQAYPFWAFLARSAQRRISKLLRLRGVGFSDSDQVHQSSRDFLRARPIALSPGHSLSSKK